MTAILRSTPPPPDYVKQTRPLAWLRLGKAAVFSVLAGLAVAVGAAFPGGDAEAQAYGGYTYSQRVCQEYGQQPRWYNVRDGQAAYNGGNSDSGWLIVLQRGGNVAPAEYEFSNSLGRGGSGTAQGALILAFTNSNHRIFTPPATNAYGLPIGEEIVDADGTRGFVIKLGNRVVIDRNDDGFFNADDMAQGLVAGFPNLWYWEQRDFTQTRAPLNYSAQYVRWAHMAWCR